MILYSLNKFKLAHFLRNGMSSLPLPKNGWFIELAFSSLNSWIPCGKMINRNLDPTKPILPPAVQLYL